MLSTKTSTIWLSIENNKSNLKNVLPVGFANLHLAKTIAKFDIKIIVLDYITQLSVVNRGILEIKIGLKTQIKIKLTKLSNLKSFYAIPVLNSAKVILKERGQKTEKRRIWQSNFTVECLDALFQEKKIDCLHRTFLKIKIFFSLGLFWCLGMKTTWVKQNASIFSVIFRRTWCASQKIANSFLMYWVVKNPATSF